MIIGPESRDPNKPLDISKLITNRDNLDKITTCTDKTNSYSYFPNFSKSNCFRYPQFYPRQYERFNFLSAMDQGGIKTIKGYLIDNTGNKKWITDIMGNNIGENDEITCVDFTSETPTDLNNFYKKYPELQYLPCDKVLLAQAKLLMQWKDTYHIPKFCGRGDDAIMNVLILINEYMPTIKNVVNFLKSDYYKNGKNFLESVFSSIGYKFKMRDTLKNIFHSNNLDIIDNIIELITVIFSKFIPRNDNPSLNSQNDDFDFLAPSNLIDSQEQIVKLFKKYLPLILNDLLSTKMSSSGLPVQYSFCLSEENLFYIIDNVYFLSQIYEREDDTNKQKGGKKYLQKLPDNHLSLCTPSFTSRTCVPNKELADEDLLVLDDNGSVKSIYNYLLNDVGEKIIIEDSESKSEDVTCLDYSGPNYESFVKKFPKLKYQPCDQLLLKQATKFFENKDKGYYIPRFCGRGDDSIINILLLIQENMPIIRRSVGLVKYYCDKKENLNKNLHDLISTFRSKLPSMNLLSSFFPKQHEVDSAYKQKYNLFGSFSFPTFNPITSIIQSILVKLNLNIVEHIIELITELFPILMDQAGSNLNEIKTAFKKYVPEILNNILSTKKSSTGEAITCQDIFGYGPDNSLDFIIDHIYYLSRIYYLDKKSLEHVKVDQTPKKEFKLRRYLNPFGFKNSIWTRPFSKNPQNHTSFWRGSSNPVPSGGKTKKIKKIKRK